MKSDFNKIFIIDSYEFWLLTYKEDEIYNKNNDLILTFDFKLKNYIEKNNGFVIYIDKIENAHVLQSYNKVVYDFFDSWYLDENNKDLFTHSGIEFGPSLKIHLWESLTFFSSMFLCLNKCKSIKHKELLVTTEFICIPEILNFLNLKFKLISNTETINIEKFYYFNINKWMNEQLYNLNLKASLHNILITIQGKFFKYFDLVHSIFVKNNKKNIFFQIYYPTETVYKKLLYDKKIKIFLERFSPVFAFKKIIIERPVPLSKFSKNLKISKHLLDNYKEKNYRKFFLNNSDVTGLIVKIFINKLENNLPNVLNRIDSINNFFKNIDLKLIVIISNIGLISSIIEAYAKKNNIPTYLIINGLFCIDYLNESKNATFINCYSESLYNNYFHKQQNAFILGDPRMDKYANIKKKSINRNYSNITIGTSAYDLIDLTSYLAIEFDFIYDILITLQKFSKNINKITIKVRSNGYLKQYKSFVDNYFKSIEIPIYFEEHKPIFDLLQESDLYISFYSQTIIESACLGIPTIYYKNDNQILYPPFNEESGLIISHDIYELQEDINHFFVSSDKFNTFLQKEVLTKYIGSLDGKNTERNLSFIYDKLFSE